jgi:hypothetical protein
LDYFKSLNSDLFENENLVLEDVETGVLYDLNSNSVVNMIIDENTKSKKMLLHFNTTQNALTQIQKLESFNTIKVKNVNGKYVAEVDLTQAGNATIEMFSVSGQLVSSSQINNVQNGILPIETSSLQKGIYLVRVTVGTKQISSKIYIQE